MAPEAQDWPAPVADAPVCGVVRVPGSKSLTNRLLVLAALADGPSTLRRPLHSRDTELMADGLRTLGVDVTTTADGHWSVTGVPGPLRPRAERVEVGNAGTVARFLPPVAALADHAVTFTGDPRMAERPLRPLLDALVTLGADVSAGPPVRVRGRGRVRGGPVDLDASASSQLVSGLLLAGPRFDEGVVVRCVGRVPSGAHLQMTVDTLRAFGATAGPQGAAGSGAAACWHVEPGALHGRRLDVEPDLSTAAPFLAAAVATGGRVELPGWPESSAQPGAQLPRLLEQMGATVRYAPGQQPGDRALVLAGTGRVRGLDVDLGDVGELAPVIAALAALADGPSRLRGIAHLRGHETDRLAALSRELGALGAQVAETEDGLLVHPRPLHGGLFRTYDDHRLAMAAAVVGLVVPGVQVENVATTAKTFPGFTAAWDQLVTGGTSR